MGCFWAAQIGLNSTVTPCVAIRGHSWYFPGAYELFLFLVLLYLGDRCYSRKRLDRFQVQSLTQPGLPFQAPKLPLQDKTPVPCVMPFPTLLAIMWFHC